jgi:hypothetical protein
MPTQADQFASAADWKSRQTIGQSVRSSNAPCRSQSWSSLVFRALAESAGRSARSSRGQPGRGKVTRISQLVCGVPLWSTRWAPPLER